MGTKAKKKTVLPTTSHIYWKAKYDALRAALQELHESENLFRDSSDEMPDECISVSDEFFISNAMEVVDNEKFALEHWGEGNYFRVVKQRLPCT